MKKSTDLDLLKKKRLEIFMKENPQYAPFDTSRLDVERKRQEKVAKWISSVEDVCKLRYENRMRISDIARKYGVTRPAIAQRIKKFEYLAGFVRFNP